MQAFLQTAFQNKAAITNAEIIYCVCCSIAKNLTTGKFVPKFPCSHEDAETAMFTVYSVLQSESYAEAVVLDTEDTDNYIQDAYVAQQTSGLLCVIWKGQLINA